MGVIAASLKAGGTVPEVRDELMMLRMRGVRQGRQDFTSGDGMGSKGQVDSFIFAVISLRSEAVMGDREARELYGVSEEAGGCCSGTGT